MRLVVTEVPSLRIKYLEIFATRQDLIDANSECAAHLLLLKQPSSACFAALLRCCIWLCGGRKAGRA